MAAYKEITANGTTTLKTGRGVLKRIIVNLPGSATLRMFDNTSAAAPAIAGGGAAFALPAAGTVMEFDCTFLTGLTVVIASVTTSSITFVWE